MGDLLDDNDPFEEDIHFDQAGLLGGKAVRTKHYHNAVGFLPTFMLFSRTVFLCIAFTGLGMCASITHNPVIKVQQWLGVPEWEALHTFTAHSIGALVGGILGSKLFDVYNRQFLVFLALVWVSVSVAVLPFTLPISLWWMRATLVAVSAGIAFLFTGGNVLCLDIWGRQGGGGALQALHFSFALGAFIAPVIIHPFFTGPQTEGLSSSTTPLPTRIIHEMLDPFAENPGDSALLRLPRFVHTTPHYDLMALSDTDILKLTQSTTNTSIFKSSSSGRANEILNGVQTVKGNEAYNSNITNLQSNSAENGINLIGDIKGSNLFDESTYNNSNVSWHSNGIIPGQVIDQHSISNNSLHDQNKVNVIPSNPKPARPKPSFTGATVKEQQSSWKRPPPKKLPTPEHEESTDELTHDTDATEQEMESTSSESGSSLGKHSKESLTVSGLSDTVVPVTNKPPINSSASNNNSLDHAGGSNSSVLSPVSSIATPSFDPSAFPNITEVISDDDQQKLLASQLSTIAPNVYSGVESSSNSSVSTNVSRQLPIEHAPSILPTMSTVVSSTVDNTSISMEPPISSAVQVNRDHLIVEPNLPTLSFPLFNMNNHSAKDTSENVPFIAPVQKDMKLVPSNPVPVPSVIPHTTTTTTNSYVELLEQDNTESNVQLQKIEQPDDAPPKQSNGNDIWHQNTFRNDTFLEPEVQDLKESQNKKLSNIAPVVGTSDNVTNSTSKIADASNIFHSIVGLLKKPGTFSNMTDNHNKFIENIAKKFQGYGVTKIHLAFICISIFVMLNSLVFVVILCHNPREPRSKQEKGYLDQAPHSRYNFFLIFFSLFMFTAEALQGAIHHLLASNSETNGLSILDKGFDGPALFWGLVCIIRFLCIMLSGCIHLKPGKILGVSTFFTALGTVFLCIGSFDKDDFMWSGIILASIGLAPTLPTSLLWMSQHMLVTHKMCAIMIILTSLGNSLTHGGLAYVASKSHFYSYILVGMSLSSVVLLVLSWFIIYTSVGRASSHLMSPNAANELTTSEGYRLARQHEEDDSDGMEMQGQCPRPRQETDQHRQLLHDHHLAGSNQPDTRMFLYQDEGALLID